MAGYRDSDAVVITYGNSADTYQFYRGGTSGTLVGTDVLIYSSTSKTILSTVVMT